MEIANAAGFSKPSQWDHRCWIWIITILAIIYSVFFLGARVMAKYGQLWWDDAVLGLGYIMAFAHWGLLMRALSSGLGAALVNIGWSSREGTISSLLLASQLLWLMCIYLMKASILVFNRKIFSGDSHRERITFAIAGATILVSVIASLPIYAAGCSPRGILDGRPGGACTAGTMRLVFVCVLDFISEVVLFSLAVSLLAPINMQREKKQVVILLYSCRFATTAFFIAQTASQASLNSSGPTSLKSAPTLVLQEITLCSSFITCTVPCLRSFVSAFNSGGTYGAATTRQNSYALQSIAPSSKQKKRYMSAESASDAKLRPDLAQHGVSAIHEQGDDLSVASDNSEQMIIRRETRVAVQFDEHT